MPPRPPATRKPAQDKDSGSGSTAAKTAKGTKFTPPRARPKEIGGPEGPEPTRYGDWERNGRCSDF
jgi:hypothetical protein